ncbi:MAG TPA: hypothetical protein GXX51_00815 [Firmicutes bacterium]|nr:hypothetical protein [Bacillota bacterium]
MPVGFRIPAGSEFSPVRLRWRGGSSRGACSGAHRTSLNLTVPVLMPDCELRASLNSGYGYARKPRVKPI